MAEDGVDARRLTFGLAGLAMVVLGVHAGSAAAQEEGVWPSNQEAHPGQIVYSRDVPYGTATRRIAQGEASTVAPDQSALIERTLGTGLQPLSDAEQALVTAPLARGMTLAEDAVVSSLSVLIGPVQNVDFARAESGGSSVGGIVSDALGVLPGALSVLSRVGGSE